MDTIVQTHEAAAGGAPTPVPAAAAIEAAEQALTRAANASAQAQTQAQTQAPAAESGDAVPFTHTGGEFLSFRLGAEEYGIEILKVQEIRSYTQPTRIANAPAYIKGVVNLRGVIVPIVDLRLKLALEHAEYNEFTVVIVLSVAHRVVGIVVDSVRDVLRLEPGQIRPAPEFNNAVDAGVIVGIGTLKEGGQRGAEEAASEDRMLILLNIERLIAASDIGLSLDVTLH